MKYEYNREFFTELMQQTIDFGIAHDIKKEILDLVTKLDANNKPISKVKFKDLNTNSISKDSNTHTTNLNNQKAILNIVIIKLIILISSVSFISSKINKTDGFPPALHIKKLSFKIKFVFEFFFEDFKYSC